MARRLSALSVNAVILLQLLHVKHPDQPSTWGSHGRLGALRIWWHRLV